MLYSFFSDIEDEKFPQMVFEDPTNYRASDLYFIGTTDEPIATSVIYDFF